MPTAAYDTVGYDPAQMWRGPAWLNTSYFALKGLQEYGFADLADRMRSTILGWVADDPSSIHEFYNSKTGAGLGAPRFGWSAVFTIAFITDWNNDNLTWLFQTDSNKKRANDPYPSLDDKTTRATSLSKGIIKPIRL
jgi:hypothetical protein